MLDVYTLITLFYFGVYHAVNSIEKFRYLGINREVAESSFVQQLFSPLVFNRAFCAVLKFKTIIRIQISSNSPQCVTPAHFFANQYCSHKTFFRQWFEFNLYTNLCSIRLNYRDQLDVNHYPLGTLFSTCDQVIAPKIGLQHLNFSKKNQNQYQLEIEQTSNT